jgi:hypothetical protein
MRGHTEHMDHQHDHHELAQEYWAREQAALDAIYSGGMQKYAESLPDLSKAFDLKSRTIRCIDEGIKQDGISLAGSGILLDESEVLGTIAHAHADGITCHEGCGAVALALKKAGKDPADADKVAQEWASQLAVRAGIPYKGFIRLADMARPPEMHIARTIYYDGTGRLALSGAPELPKGFIISRKYTNRHYAEHEIKVAIDIAMGDHGFGQLITEDQPLVIIPIAAVGRGELDADRLRQEVENASVGFGGRVRIDGLTVSEDVFDAELAAA